jgi:hypothetical protein
LEICGYLMRVAPGLDNRNGIVRHHAARTARFPAKLSGQDTEFSVKIGARYRLNGTIVVVKGATTSQCQFVSRERSLSGDTCCRQVGDPHD